MYVAQSKALGYNIKYDVFGMCFWNKNHDKTQKQLHHSVTFFDFLKCCFHVIIKTN